MVEPDSRTRAWPVKVDFLPIGDIDNFVFDLVDADTARWRAGCAFRTTRA